MSSSWCDKMFSRVAADLRSWKLILYGTDVDPLHPESNVPPPRPAVPVQPSATTTGPPPLSQQPGAQGTVSPTPTAPTPVQSQGLLGKHNQLQLILCLAKRKDTVNLWFRPNHTWRITHIAGQKHAATHS